jgi:hypothetical protein
MLLLLKYRVSERHPLYFFFQLGGRRFTDAEPAADFRNP